MFIALIYDGTNNDDVLLTYLNAWTKENNSLTAEYLLKFVNSSRISLWYELSNTTIHTCLTTKSIPWQDRQSWTINNCTIEDHPLILDYRAVRKTDDVILKTL